MSPRRVEETFFLPSTQRSDGKADILFKVCLSNNTKVFLSRILKEPKMEYKHP